MALSLKPERIKRYKDVVALLIKYGRSDLVQQADLDISPSERERALAPTAEPKAEELAADLEKLGPTFIKLLLPHPKALTQISLAYFGK